MKGMRKTALFCALCLFAMLIPVSTIASEEVSVVVSDVANDIVTVEGPAPVDAVISILILNPGKTVSDVLTDRIEAVQYLGKTYSLNGKFTCNIKMNTGIAPNKKEGSFTVFVTVDDNLVYTNPDFVFYSNETKSSYIDDLKNCSEAELLQIEHASLTKIEKIFETFSFSNHELYKEATPENLAKAVVLQSERKNLSQPTDVNLFLNKVLVFNAFSCGSKTLLDGDGIKYTELWAKDGNEVSTLYTKSFEKELNSKGKKAVIDALLKADYSGKEFTAPLEVLKDEILVNVIFNNISYGAGHIDGYMLNEFNAEYKAKGFNTDALAAIKDSEKHIAKLEEILLCGATSIDTFKTKFNEIVTANDNENSGDNTARPPVNAPSSGGGGGGGFTPTQTPAPTEAPKPTEAPEVTPEAAYPFTDMSGATWAEDAVKYLYEKGIINGRNEKTFAPGETVTRAELVKMIVEALSVSAEEDKTFSDVNDGDWFASYVKKAAAAGIVTGDGLAFRPNGEVTREDAAVIIFRALGLENGGEISFTDAGNISDYAKDAISAMAAGGYINGMGDGTFAPKMTLTRAQAAQLIYNALVKGDAK